MLTIRAEERQASRAAAIAALRRETVSDILRTRLDEYINEYRGLLGEHAFDDDEEVP
jgi:hypothetical protein